MLNLIRFGIRFGIPKPSQLRESDRTPHLHQHLKNFYGWCCLRGAGSFHGVSADQIQNGSALTREAATFGLGA